jgi:hypothetical protein
VAVANSVAERLKKKEQVFLARWERKWFNSENSEHRSTMREHLRERILQQLPEGTKLSIVFEYTFYTGVLRKATITRSS